MPLPLSAHTTTDRPRAAICWVVWVLDAYMRPAKVPDAG